MKPALRIIEAESAEARLRRLFAAEDALLAELARVRDEQRLARNDYASERGLLMRPSVDALRKVLHSGNGQG